MQNTAPQGGGAAPGRTEQQRSTPDQTNTQPLAPNLDDARELFALLAKADGIHLVAILPDRQADDKPHGRNFGSDAEAAVAWATEKNKRCGIYWTSNLVAAGMHKKPTKADITAARIAHADLDPPKDGTPWDKRAALDEIMELAQPPSFVIDSGNGLQPVWMMADPTIHKDMIEGVNRRIEAELAADSCHNIDRLLRVPGFVNWPNEKKRKAGRVPVLAGWAMRDDEVRYTPEELAFTFTPMTADELEAHRGKGAKPGKGSAQEPWAVLTADQQMTLHSIVFSPPGRDRSGDLMAFARKAIEAGVADDLIIAIGTDARYAIAAHALDQGDPVRAVRRAIDAVRATPGYAGAQELPARAFEEILADAQSVSGEDLEAVETLIAEAARLSPVRCDQVHRAIRNATGIPLGIMRKQTQGDAPPEPDHLEMARMTLETIGRENIICADAFVWMWQDRGVWQTQEDRAIMQRVQTCLADSELEVIAGIVKAVTDVLKTDIFKPDHEFNLGNPESVNCTNGELELIGGQWQLKPHSRENYRTTQIPVAFDRSATAPRWLQFLGEIFRDDPDKDDKVQALHELIGYTLMSHARHEKFVMLIGPGANGKSVALAVIEALCGPENVAGVQPSNFDRSFQRAHLHQKLANIVTELRQGEVIADAELKAITSGEPATVEHKFKDPFVMRPFATCWFGTNHMPHTRDFSEALFRRATILQFNRTFAKDEQDPLLKNKLFAELPGILNLSLDAYAAALVHGFTNPASSEDAKREWRLEADQVAQFVDDCCETAPGAMVRASDVFMAYDNWAQNNGIKTTVAARGLRERLTRLGYGAHRDKRARYITGMQLRVSL
ncbi:MAG: DNA primase family protein [Erythrobacter sp.]